MRNFVALVLFSVAFVCCRLQPVRIYQIFPTKDIFENDSVSNGLKQFKSVNFVVQNYRNSKLVEERIRAFADSIGSKEAAQFHNYWIYFFKESSVTNPENLVFDPRAFQRYSYGHDLVFKFIYSEGYYSWEKIKNGGAIKGSRPSTNIEVKPISLDSILH